MCDSRPATLVQVHDHSQLTCCIAGNNTKLYLSNFAVPNLGGSELHCINATVTV